jgi:hypothetical protein
VTSFDFSNITIVLNYPLIPIPHSILIEILEDLANDAIPAINDWLSFHEFLLPQSLATLTPMPIMNVKPQTECCLPAWQHGYIDSESYDVPESYQAKRETHAFMTTVSPSTTGQPSKPAIDESQPSFGTTSQHPALGDDERIDDLSSIQEYTGVVKQNTTALLFVFSSLVNATNK